MIECSTGCGFCLLFVIRPATAGRLWRHSNFVIHRLFPVRHCGSAQRSVLLFFPDGCAFVVVLAAVGYA